jgi:hypothetical protein
MTVRTWVGGGNNDIYAANNWSPNGSPQPGDILSLYTGSANMAGGNLAGDTLNVGTQTSFSSAPMAVVNLSDGAHLTAVAATTSFTQQQIIFNARGFDTLDLTINNNPTATMTVTENIADHSILSGSFVAGGHNADLSIQGAGTSVFDNDGASSITEGVASINAHVLGVGSFGVGGNAGLTFLSSVGFGQTVNSQGFDTITIGDPHAFHGLVSLQSDSDFGVVLDGVTNADSFSYRNDLLTLFDGKQAIDTLRLAANGNAFQVTENSTGVTIGPSIYSAQNPPPAGTTLLPESTPAHGVSA